MDKIAFLELSGSTTYVLNKTQLKDLNFKPENALAYPLADALGVLILPFNPTGSIPDELQGLFSLLEEDKLEFLKRDSKGIIFLTKKMLTNLSFTPAYVLAHSLYDGLGILLVPLDAENTIPESIKEAMSPVANQAEAEEL